MNYLHFNSPWLWMRTPNLGNMAYHSQGNE